LDALSYGQCWIGSVDIGLCTATGGMYPRHFFLTASKSDVRVSYQWKQKKNHTTCTVSRLAPEMAWLCLWCLVTHLPSSCFWPLSTLAGTSKTDL